MQSPMIVQFTERYAYLQSWQQLKKLSTEYAVTMYGNIIFGNRWNAGSVEAHIWQYVLCTVVGIPQKVLAQAKAASLQIF